LRLRLYQHVILTKFQGSFILLFLYINTTNGHESEPKEVAFMSFLFDEIFGMENLEKAYRNTLREDGKYRNEALIFQRNETVNLMRLQKLMYSGNYKFSSYETFEVFEPKRRVINAPKYQDKIVQAALNIKLNEIYN